MLATEHNTRQFKAYHAYIQAGIAVPQAWLEAEMNDAQSNPAYYNAILRDVATFGIHRAHHERQRATRGFKPDYGTEG